MKDVFLRFLIFGVVLKIHRVATDFMDTKCYHCHYGWVEHSDLKRLAKYVLCQDLLNDILFDLLCYLRFSS